MPEYLHPGVYVEETTFRSKSIEGVSTTTTGFVGPCRSGPIIAPSHVITSLAQFERTYAGGAKLAFTNHGQPDAATPTENYLWHAVRAFFAEGGKRLYIARVFRPLRGDYPPDFSNPENLGPDADPSKTLWADGHARATHGGMEFRSRYPGAAGNVIVRITASAGETRFEADERPEIEPPRDVGNSTHGLTISINIISADRKHDLGTWSGLSLDPPDHLSGRDSVLGVFCETPRSISEKQVVPLVISSGTHPTAAHLFDQLFGNLLTVTADDEKIFGKNDTLARKLAAGVTVEIALLGGNDGIRPGGSEYEGIEDENGTFKTGLRQFEEIDDISIVAAPGSTANYEQDRDEAHAIYESLIRHATMMRWRIAVLDSPPRQSVADVRKVRAKLDSSYAAFYYPWVTIHDPVTGRELNLPPSGFVTGIYARSDVNRAVYKAPANEVVNLAIGFEQLLNKEHQEVLNPEGINCFRFFEGRGFRLWGARTISSDPEWKYVNVRRYFAYLEHSIDKGTQWAVFEPNGPPLWAIVRRAIEDFLLTEFQMGALPGEKPEQAYFVKCDRSTITQDDLDNGRLVALIGVALSRPAEFVIFRIGQWTADHKVNPPFPQLERPITVHRDRPYVQFNFLVDFAQGSADGPHAGFQECSGLGVEVTVAKFPSSKVKRNRARKITGLNKATDVTLKRGVIRSGSLYQWLSDIRHVNQNAVRNVLVQLQNEDHTAIVQTWKLIRARITKYISGPLNAKGTDVAIEELTITCDRLEVE